METRRFVRGFTLIETALALGIFAFGLIAVVGLLPVALNSMRASIDISLKTTMIQSMQARLLDLPFSSQSQTFTMSFDDEGMLVEGEGERPPRYKLTATINPGASLPGGTLPSLAVVDLTMKDMLTNASSRSCLFISDNGL